jgi:hypothetical protein
MASYKRTSKNVSKNVRKLELSLLLGHIQIQPRLKLVLAELPTLKSQMDNRTRLSQQNLEMVM